MSELSPAAHDQGTIAGLLAEFATPEALVEAARRAYEAGYRRMDAYSPFPIEELAESLGFHHTRLPWVVFAGGLIGGIGGYFLQYYAAVIDYPLNIGGRPLHSWPAFIPVTFEMTVLCASLAAVLGMLALNGLPQPYHPLFNVPEFGLASRDKFFLYIESRDKRFDPTETARFLAEAAATRIMEVPP